MRLASLACSNTDILAALGLAAQLVAVDRFSDAPGIGRAARLGPDLNIDVAALAALKPDLVLSSLSVPGMEKVVAGVERAGLRQLVLDPESWDDVLRDMLTVGEVLGAKGRAENVVAGMRDEAEVMRRTFARPPRVSVEWWPRPVIVAGGRSWVTDMLRLLGAGNAFGALDARSAPLEVQAWRDARPDLAVVSWCGVAKLRPEIVQKRGAGVPVVCVPESGLGRPGPRLVEGLHSLSAALAQFV